MEERPYKFPIAREGWRYILVSLFLAASAAGMGVYWLAAALAVFGMFSFWFFRDPQRRPPPNESAVVSPADGKVIKVDTEAVDPVLGRQGQLVSIFMSVFNVHVNRAPVTGQVAKIKYTPGKFLVASLDKASDQNERNALIIKPSNGEDIVVIQIAGLIARRIACWVKPGDEVTRGSRFGLIRFGSRLDVYLPREAKMDVRPGQKVRAGESILGRLVAEGSVGHE